MIEVSSPEPVYSGDEEDKKINILVKLNQTKYVTQSIQVGGGLRSQCSISVDCNFDEDRQDDLDDDSTETISKPKRRLLVKKSIDRTKLTSSSDMNDTIVPDEIKSSSSTKVGLSGIGIKSPTISLPPSIGKKVDETPGFNFPQKAPGDFVLGKIGEGSKDAPSKINLPKLPSVPIKDSTNAFPKPEIDDTQTEENKGPPKPALSLPKMLPAIKTPEIAKLETNNIPATPAKPGIPLQIPSTPGKLTSLPSMPKPAAPINNMPSIPKPASTSGISLPSVPKPAPSSGFSMPKPGENKLPTIPKPAEPSNPTPSDAPSQPEAPKQAETTSQASPSVIPAPKPTSSFSFNLPKPPNAIPKLPNAFETKITKPAGSDSLAPAVNAPAPDAAPAQTPTDKPNTDQAPQLKIGGFPKIPTLNFNSIGNKPAFTPPAPPKPAETPGAPPTTATANNAPVPKWGSGGGGTGWGKSAAGPTGWGNFIKNPISK